jgi:hypothetical protein
VLIAQNKHMYLSRCHFTKHNMHNTYEFAFVVMKFMVLKFTKFNLLKMSSLCPPHNAANERAHW